ncbi:hypothetical protein Tco_0071440 [Tanacetum coccineum]|uniref:Uncharacterized protein n=1 Tax=Tanacetum coccineum TaxID=301880 RepID=A0ABQ4Z9M1_9ASTR
MNGVLLSRTKQRLFATEEVQTRRRSDYDEVCAPLLALKQSTSFWHLTSFHGFTVYQDGCQKCIFCMQPITRRRDIFQTASRVIEDSCSSRIRFQSCQGTYWPASSSKSMIVKTLPKVLIYMRQKESLATIRADLLFDDENGVDCFPKQVIWDALLKRILATRVLRALHKVCGNNLEQTCASRCSALVARMLKALATQRAAHSQMCCSFSTYCFMYNVLLYSFHGRLTLRILRNVKGLLNYKDCFADIPREVGGLKKQTLSQAKVNTSAQSQAQEIFQIRQASGQGYKNLQKLKYPQMKELYDKVQASIKDSFKDFIPMDSEKEREMLKERDAKRLLRKRKATSTEDTTPSEEA